MSNLGASGSPVMDLSDLVDGRKVSRSAIIFLVIATLAMIGDGYDIAAMGFVVPEIVKSWHVERAALVPALSAGVFGLLLGAPLFGFVGDRFGRKTAILLGLGSFGLLTLLTAFATSLNQFVVLRFLTGLGLGGMIPNIIALSAEAAPKRLRGVFVIIISFGVPAGFVLPGYVTALLVPTYGWPALLLVGGVLPLVIAGLAYFLLQESIRYLLMRGDRDAEVRRAAQALRPDLVIDSRARFSARSDSPITAGRRGSPLKLFSSGLAFVTPALWIALAANQFTNFFTLSWLPTLLQSSGLSTAQAGIVASNYSIGGIVGGVILLFIIDRLGALPVVLLFAVGAPLVASIGFPGLPPLMLSAIIAAAGFCVTGNNFALNAVMGMIYPTPIRAIGTGWAQGFGRLGALAAQWVGGILLARHLSMQEVYLGPGISLGIGALASGFLAWMCFRRFGSLRLDDTSAADKAAVTSAARGRSSADLEQAPV